MIHILAIIAIACLAGCEVHNQTDSRDRRPNVDIDVHVEPHVHPIRPLIRPRPPCVGPNCPYRLNPAANDTVRALGDQPPDGTLFTSTFPFYDLPEQHRCKNYAGGSCVIASTVNLFKTQNRDDLATLFREHYSGGQSSQSLMAKFNANHVVFCATTNGDFKFLEWCVRTRRWATIFFYPSHSINFCGMQGETVFMLDNNRVGRYIEIERRKFEREWRGYGGFAAAVLVGEPPAPDAHLSLSLQASAATRSAHEVN